MSKLPTDEEQRVWAYLLQHRDARAFEVAEAVGVSEALVATMMDRISSDNWREEVTPPATSGVKFDTDKLPMHLLPPELLAGTAAVLDFGARKYTPRNWELGMEWHRPYSALMRHMWAWWGGEDFDPETGLLHTWHAACCIAFLMAYEQRKIGTDDRPKGAIND